MFQAGHRIPSHATGTMQHPPEYTEHYRITATKSIRASSNKLSTYNSGYKTWAHHKCNKMLSAVAHNLVPKKPSSCIMDVYKLSKKLKENIIALECKA